MLERLGLAARRWITPPLWTNVYGLARTLLAVGTLATLAATPTASLFQPASGVPAAPYCNGATGFTLFCVVPDGSLGLARWAGVGVLLVVATGWRPRLTAIPHWWVTVSVPLTLSTPDGGDQVAQILTLLLLPVALADGRRWHWARPVERRDTAGADVVALVAVTALFVVRVQVAAIYLQASVAKLGVDEWRDGTALYYWMTDTLFGAPGWIAQLVRQFVGSGVGVTVLTWGTLVLEFSLAMGLFLPRRHRRWLLVGGILFHGGIGFFMGLWSFALAMFAALILYLWPVDQPFRLPAVVAGPMSRVVARMAFFRRDRHTRTEPPRRTDQTEPAGRRPIAAGTPR